MAEIQIAVKNIRGTSHVQVQSNVDENGPALEIALVDRDAFITALNLMVNPGTPQEIVTGEFNNSDFNNNKIQALFQNEADIDAYLLTKPNNWRKLIEVSSDGFSFKALSPN